MNVVVAPHHILNEVFPFDEFIFCDQRKLPDGQLGVGAQKGGALKLSGLQVQTFTVTVTQLLNSSQVWPLIVFRARLLKYVVCDKTPG
jgi:hypothetical protein